MFSLPTDDQEERRDEGERGDVFQCRCFEIQRGFCFSGCGEELTMMSAWASSSGNSLDIIFASRYRTRMHPAILAFPPSNRSARFSFDRQ